MNEPEFYYYYIKCEMCGNIELKAGPRRSEMTWHEFSNNILREFVPQFKYCANCKKHTLQGLIAFESE